MEFLGLIIYLVGFGFIAYGAYSIGKAVMRRRGK